MSNKTYTLTFSDDDLKNLDIAYFTLNYLGTFQGDLDCMQGGLCAVTENAIAKIEAISGLFYNAIFEKESAPCDDDL